MLIMTELSISMNGGTHYLDPATQESIRRGSFVRAIADFVSVTATSFCFFRLSRLASEQCFHTIKQLSSLLLKETFR